MNETAAASSLTAPDRTPLTLLQRFRIFELEPLRHYFRPGTRVLEIGGGSGFQAHLLTEWGCAVTAVDIGGYPSSGRYYPVDRYDGVHLPYADGSFDVVFSSNVFEHVPQRNLALLDEEISRVLAARGVAIHIMPSSAWRWWTSISHYIYLLKFALTAKHTIPTDGPPPPASEVLRRKGIRHLIRRIALPGAHGEYRSAVHELFTYSRNRWNSIFLRDGFEVVESAPTNIYYSGYGLLPKLSMATRQRLAPLLGSAGNVFVMRPMPLASRSTAPTLSPDNLTSELP